MQQLGFVCSDTPIAIWSGLALVCYASRSNASPLCSAVTLRPRNAVSAFLTDTWLHA